MIRIHTPKPSWLAVVLVLSAGFAWNGDRHGGPGATRYEDLVALFTQWRAFQRPPLIDGVPDYSARAMTAQKSELAQYQRRLTVLDTTGWSVAQQVDYHLVRAEMNGLDFDHRVLRPWARNPAFYVSLFASQSDQPAREGPHAEGAIELWTYQFPLSAQAATTLATQLRLIPRLLDQARGNLVEGGKDLWRMGVQSVQTQSVNLSALAGRVSGNATLAAEVQRAREATDQFRAWLEQQAPSRTAGSGIGIENYDWYLKNVQLVPLTWQDEVTLMRRELARATAALRLEEERNRALPPLEPIANAADWERRFTAAVTEYLAFLRQHEVLTVPDYLDPALRARLGRFSPGPREFFNEVNYRDPIVMRTHDYHWLDLARMAKEPHTSPIRRGPLLYNIFDTRTEGHATAMEEMMRHAGFLDGHPRSRELIYVLIAQRAARALGDLLMHANQLTLDESVRFVSSQTPRGWLRENGTTVWGEQHLYLQQPAYGTSYLIGKAQIEAMMADRVRQLGEQFTVKRFMDEFNAAGLIPASLVRWELTGQADEIARLAR